MHETWANWCQRSSCNCWDSVHVTLLLSMNSVNQLKFWDLLTTIQGSNEQIKKGFVWKVLLWVSKTCPPTESYQTHSQNLSAIKQFFPQNILGVQIVFTKHLKLHLQSTRGKNWSFFHWGYVRINIWTGSQILRKSNQKPEQMKQGSFYFTKQLVFWHNNNKWRESLTILTWSVVPRISFLQARVGGLKWLNSRSLIGTWRFGQSFKLFELASRLYKAKVRLNQWDVMSRKTLTESQETFSRGSCVCRRSMEAAGRTLQPELHRNWHTQRWIQTRSLSWSVKSPSDHCAFFCRRIRLLTKKRWLQHVLFCIVCVTGSMDTFVKMDATFQTNVMPFLRSWVRDTSSALNKFPKQSRCTIHLGMIPRNSLQMFFHCHLPIFAEGKQSKLDIRFLINLSARKQGFSLPVVNLTSILPLIRSNKLCFFTVPAILLQWPRRKVIRTGSPLDCCRPD